MQSRSRTWSGGACLLLALATGCREAHDGAPRSVLRRPELVLANAQAVAPTARVERSLVPPCDVAPWVLRGMSEVVPRASGADDGCMIRFSERGNHRINIPGPFDPRTFNRIEVRGVFRSVYTLTINFSADSKLLTKSSQVASLVEADEQTLSFELPQLRKLRSEIDQISIGLVGPAEGCDIHRIDLVDVPLALAMPLPTSGGGPISIGQESRFGVGLSHGEPLVARAVVERGDVLQFAYGQPPMLRDPAQTWKLIVSIASAERTKSYTFPVLPDLTWREARIDLEADRGPVELRFELVGTRPTAGICALAEVILSRPSASAPTVVLITSDTHRADHLGSAGSSIEIQTAAIDALAQRGVFYEQAWSSTNVTSPSHAALMTGLHPRQTQLVTNTGQLTDAAHTLAEVFRAAGFATIGAVGVRHLGPRGSGLAQGFDRLAAPPQGVRRAGETVDQVLSWMPAFADRPLFVWLHVFDAHYPYEPPDGFDRMYYPADKDPFAAGAAAIEGSLPEELRGLTDLAFPMAQYRAEISYLDDRLSLFLNQPRVRDGVIAFTADHGEILARNDSFFNHAALYPATLHVPLIVAWPGANADRKGQPVSHLGVGRTLLDLAGLEAVPFPGESLLELEPGAHEQPRFALSAHGFSASVSYAEWHLVLHLRQHAGCERAHQVELYDVRSDPRCERDLSPTEAARCASLRRMLVRWLCQEAGASLAQQKTVSSEQVKELAALGYAPETEAVGSAQWFDPACDCVECAAFE